MDLDNGVCLRTKHIRALAILGYPTHSATFTLSTLHLPCFDFVGSSSRNSCWFMLSCCSKLSWAFLTMVPMHPLARVYTHFSDVQALATLLRSFLQPRSSPPSLPTPFSTTLLLVFRSSHFSAQALLSESPPPQFSQSKQPWYRSTTGDQMGDALSCLSINWKTQDMQLLFGPGVIKIYSKATR